MLIKMFKQKEVTIIGILKYEELSVKNIWLLMKAADDLCEYFPDYSDKQILDRDLSSLYCEHLDVVLLRRW